VRNLLERRNRKAIRDLETLLDYINQAQLPDELIPYRNLVQTICAQTQLAARQNIDYLTLLPVVDVLEEMLSRTNEVIRSVNMLSAIRAVPVFRLSHSDRLSLSIIGWLHTTHPQTRVHPPTFIDGNWGVYPFVQTPPIYFIPYVEQRSLLFQPLLFHEFGHVLYRYHQQEMDDLIGDLQSDVLELLAPPSQRNDQYESEQASQRQRIVITWYRWIIELFCDGVGFLIGGPSFAYAFSATLNTMHPDDFYSRRNDLQNSTHPLPWLRAQFLAKRASSMGFNELAQHIEAEWQQVADAMQIVEDYHGFYDNTLEELVNRTLEDMLVEADPRHFTTEEAAGEAWIGGADSPVRLLNWAWQKYLSSPGEYSEWEKEHVAQLLERDGAD
jgi:hypothetical protein